MQKMPSEKTVNVVLVTNFLSTLLYMIDPVKASVLEMLGNTTLDECGVNFGLE